MNRPDPPGSLLAGGGRGGVIASLTTVSSKLNDQQRLVLRWLRRSDRPRVLYEGVAGGKGSGEFFVTCSNAPPLTRGEVDQLVDAGCVMSEPRVIYRLRRTRPSP